MINFLIGQAGWLRRKLFLLTFLGAAVCSVIQVRAGSAATAESLGIGDGEYTVEVTLEGGTGRTMVNSPTALEIRDGEATAAIVFDSPNYDYVIVNGEKYIFENAGGTEQSRFEIPVDCFDEPIPMIADTIAMSVPHEIEYTLCFDSATIREAGNADESDAEKEAEDTGEQNKELSSEEVIQVAAEPEEIPGLTFERRMELLYAEEFSVDYYEGGYALISIENSGRFLVVPEGKQAPEKLDVEITVLQQPICNIYLVATSAMDLFCAIDGIGNIRLSGTKESGWYIPEAKAALADGRMLYAGKYNAPDYELILSEGCDLAIESTMIYHNPEVKEKLEQFGIPVMVERSSYESHPLGRTEWMKLYAVLLGKEKIAEEIFREQANKLDHIQSQENTGKTVAFFFINSVGSVNVRKSNDYIANMIALAGGRYVPDDLISEENSLSTVNMQMEEFYAKAREADYIIYNSTIDGELDTVAQLLEKSPLMADFKAVAEGNVWCTGKNLFQETTGLGKMIEDIHEMLTGGEDVPDELTYMHRLK